MQNREDVINNSGIIVIGDGDNSISNLPMPSCHFGLILPSAPLTGAVWAVVRDGVAAGSGGRRWAR